MVRYSDMGMENLAVGIIRSAYDDLIDARIADAAHKHHTTSYNCAMEYRYLSFGKMKYGVGQDGGRIAEEDVETFEEWFRSEDCKVFCRKAEGSWFIEIAKQKIDDFINDRIPRWETKPRYSGSGDKYELNAQLRRDRKEWKIARDKWRAEHGLGKVED